MSGHGELNGQEQQRLLEIARQSISDAAGGRGPAPLEAEPDGLTLERGAFVTIHRHGNLRGCIGNFTAEGPLADTVQQMAVSAALHDPRFPPVSPDEMDELDLEISVLSPLSKIENVGEIEVGVHGIYIISPRGRGVLLPQVAAEWGWDRDTFLDQTCVKAGLQPGCWRDDDVEILIFSAQVFGEEDHR